MRHDADEIAGDGDVVGAGLAADDIERAEHDALGLFDAGSGGRAEADAQQRRVGVGEQLGADAREQEVEEAARRRRDRPARAASGCAGRRADSGS